MSKRFPPQRSETDDMLKGIELAQEVNEFLREKYLGLLTYNQMAYLILAFEEHVKDRTPGVMERARFVMKTIDDYEAKKENVVCTSFGEDSTFNAEIESPPSSESISSLPSDGGGEVSGVGV